MKRALVQHAAVHACHLPYFDAAADDLDLSDDPREASNREGFQVAHGAPRAAPGAHFDADAWEEDLPRTTPAGRQVAETARKEYEQHGVPITQLRRVTEHGHDRTVLPDCMKVYVPAPDGRFGMIFVLKFEPDGRPVLMFLAFGVRHHPKARGAPYRLPTRPPAPARTATKALSLNTAIIRVLWR